MVPVRVPVWCDLAGDRCGRHGRDIHLQHNAPDQGGVSGAAGGGCGHVADGRHLLEGSPSEEEEEEGGRVFLLRTGHPVMDGEMVR